MSGYGCKGLAGLPLFAGLADAARALEQATGKPPTRIDLGAKVGRELARIGAERAADKADKLSPDWLARARDVALTLASTRETFTATDCRRVHPIPDGADSRAYGSVIRKLAEEGHLVRVDIGSSSDPKRHAGMQSVWRQAMPGEVAPPEA